MGAVLGLEIESSASWKDDDMLGMEGEKVLDKVRFILGDLGEEKRETSSAASCL